MSATCVFVSATPSLCTCTCCSLHRCVQAQFKEFMIVRRIRHNAGSSRISPPDNIEHTSVRATDGLWSTKSIYRCF